jgi:uncharacterized protein (TIGR00725 family)
VARAQAYVAVIGGSGIASDAEEALLAREVGRLVAERGAVLVCGGMDGVMEGASRGAAEAGGTVLGILPGADPGAANEWVTHAVATGIGQARNLAVVASGDVVIAIGGAFGTLSEIGHARSLGRTVIALRSWRLSGRGGAEESGGLQAVETPATAVDAAFAARAALA